MKGGQPYNYLYLVNLLKRGGVQSEEDKKRLSKFIGNEDTPETPQVKMIKLWHTLREFDAASQENDKAESDEILSRIVDDYLECNFEHEKPELRQGLKAGADGTSDCENKHD